METALNQINPNNEISLKNLHQEATDDLTPVLVSPAIRAQPMLQHTPWEPYHSRSCVA